MNLTNLISDKN